MSPFRVLLLGGTAEAADLAHRLAATPGIDLTVSLAGRTAAPRPAPGRLRIGGFGGAEGLARYLTDNRIDVLIDATHPFAERIAANAAQAADTTGTPRIKLLRPPWPVEPGWQSFPDLAAALAALPAGAKVLATTGSARTGALTTRPDCHIVLRSIEPVETLPPHVTPLIARPPFSLEQEAALMARHGVTHLMTRNAGGAHRARLDAARQRGVAVLLIDRPAPPPGDHVETVEAALDRVRNLLPRPG